MFTPLQQMLPLAAFRMVPPVSLKPPVMVPLSPSRLPGLLLDAGGVQTLALQLQPLAQLPHCSVTPQLFTNEPQL
ncbi:MAG TPA: hypothetical protein VM686_37135 [Polyangiaceae bacterium]|nr:hypothetical protein [Polyangiaceae bacterium]